MAVGFNERGLVDVLVIAGIGVVGFILFDRYAGRTADSIVGRAPQTPGGYREGGIVSPPRWAQDLAYLQDCPPGLLRQGSDGHWVCTGSWYGGQGYREDVTTTCPSAWWNFWGLIPCISGNT